MNGFGRIDGEKKLDDWLPGDLFAEQEAARAGFAGDDRGKGGSEPDVEGSEASGARGLEDTEGPRGRAPQKRAVPDGVWSQCPCCNEAIFNRELDTNLKVCPKCDFHLPIGACERIELLLDPGTFRELAGGLRSTDPLEFEATRSYTDTIAEAEARTGLEEAVIVGTGEIEGRPVAIAVMDFSFIGGSMGSVVGEKVARIAESALERRLPLLAVCASGGARMQEGMLSLMQMAKTSAAIARFHQAGLPFISLLCHPTTGGVTASFASLADVVLAEPKALIGFAGPRVIEQTIKQRLPRDFQRAEFLLEHGMVDLVVDRASLRRTIARLLDYLVHGA